MAQEHHNESRAALNYVNAAETKHKGLAKGDTPWQVTTHKDNELMEYKHK